MIGHGQVLREERFWQLFSELQRWRIDPFIRQIEAKQARGRILPFVRGLRFSARLIYSIREILNGTNMTACWGHLLDEPETLCSCECDIIIHRQGRIRRWNGTEKPVMDFRFVPHQNAIVVISCKSYLRSDKIDKEYCQLMRPFCEKIWLFAECCGPRSTDSIRNKASQVGYDKFWYLYTWSKNTEPIPNPQEWIEFEKEILKISNSDF